MWAISGIGEDGQRRPISFREVEAHSRDAVAGAFREVLGGRTFEAFDSETRQVDSLLGIEGIEQWGERAVGLLENDVRLDRTYILPDRTVPAILNGHSMAFRDPAVLVADLSGLQEAVISKERFELYNPVGPYFR